MDLRFKISLALLMVSILVMGIWIYVDSRPHFKIVYNGKDVDAIYDNHPSTFACLMDSDSCIPSKIIILKEKLSTDWLDENCEKNIRGEKSCVKNPLDNTQTYCKFQPTWNCSGYMVYLS